MKYHYTEPLLSLVKFALEHPEALAADKARKKQFETHLGYHLLPALSMLKRHIGAPYSLYNEELLQIGLNNPSIVIHIASLFLILHKAQCLNNESIALMKQTSFKAHSGAILDMLLVIEKQDIRTLTPRLFEQICTHAEKIDNPGFLNTFFDTYYRLGHQNKLKLRDIESLFQIESNRDYDLAAFEQTTQDRETALVARWQEENIFSRAIQRPGQEKFVTYDGPPFATGLPHYGHVLAMSIKGAISAHKALSSYDVETKFGWDCHGVPVEMIVQKKLGLDHHQNIMNLGIEPFNNECRQQIFTCVDAWEHDTKRLGRFIDMGLGNDYRTMDLNYMSSVWGVFGQLHQKDLIYKGFKVVAYSPSLGTALSDFEAGLEYKKIISPSITLTFPVKDEENTQFLVWTTTPWSVPANVAIAVNPQFQYVKVHHQGQYYILLKSRYQDYFKSATAADLEDIDIRQYLDKSYWPVFDTLPLHLDEEVLERCYRVRASDHVTEDNGSGCVHICPAYGLDDHKLGERYALPIIDFIDNNGLFKEVKTRSGESLNLEGLYFKYYKNPEESKNQTADVADTVLIKYMKSQQRLFKNEQIHHEYPLCWRTHQPLMYRAIESWFVKVSSFKDQLIENNATVNWLPEHIGTTRFANWLKSAHDWAISRTRYWGCPIPVWVCVTDPNDIIVIQSKEMLEELTGQTLDDLHREHIDDIEIVQNNKCYRRIPEVLDCWFESGSMPYAQYGLSFKTDQTVFLQEKFPADFIAEGLDQTRGWFYALSVIGTALFNQIPFKNVIVNGILLGNNGKKMSKSEGNYPPIESSFRNYGADVMRLSLLGSPAVKADHLAVKDELFRDTNKNTMIPLINIFKFFAQTANQYHWRPFETIDIQHILQTSTAPMNPFDAWLIYRVETFKQDMKQQLDAYDLIKASQQIKDFITDLSEWYVRISRTRISQENTIVLSLLHHALDVFSFHCAPFMPFIAENIHQSLYPNSSSIHLKSYPNTLDLAHLRADFLIVEQVRDIYTMTLALREEHRLRLRQPISSIYLDEELAASLRPYETELKNLCNCKEIIWINAKSNHLFDKKIQLAADLGARLKRDFKAVKDAFQKGDYQLDEQGEQLIFTNGRILSLQAKDFYYVVATKQTDFAYKTKANTWVVIHTQLNQDLLQEGYVRDILRELVKLRIHAGYHTDDLMLLQIHAAQQALVPQLAASLPQHKYQMSWLKTAPSDDYQSHQFKIGERGMETITLAYKKQAPGFFKPSEDVQGSQDAYSYR